MLDGVFKVSDAVLNLSNHGLSEVSDLFLHGRFHLMEFVPELFFDLWHIAPCVHPIGLNICYFLLDLIERDQYVYDTDCADISRYWFIVRGDCFSAEHVVLINHEYHWDDDYNEVCNNYYYEYPKDIPTDLNYPSKNRDWMKI